MSEEGTKRGVADCERWKKQYDTIYIDKRFNEYRCVGVTYSAVLPVVVVVHLFPSMILLGIRCKLSAAVMHHTSTLVLT